MGKPVTTRSSMKQLLTARLTHGSAFGQLLRRCLSRLPPEASAVAKLPRPPTASYYTDVVTSYLPPWVWRLYSPKLVVPHEVLRQQGRHAPHSKPIDLVTNWGLDVFQKKDEPLQLTVANYVKNYLAPGKLLGD